MKKTVFTLIQILFCIHLVFCQKQGKDTIIVLKHSENIVKTDADIQTGAVQTEKYFSLLKGKTVAVVCNHTSMLGKIHLVDTLLQSGIHVAKVFAPEHGFRGTQDAGAKIENSTDKKTSLPVISLYGSHFKPTSAELHGVEFVIFDIQDVGARFYTFISTLHYVMEACAENNIPLIVLDRPNPNGFYVDGPILEKRFSSFVGIDPIPIVHGLTVGEYAQMINGEHWLKDSLQCMVHVIPVKNYSHTDLYQLPVKPSPNLPNMTSVYLYPSLCLFEGTIVSVGRGTDKPFQVIGFPTSKNGTYSFTPHKVPGAASPPYENSLCKGYDVSTFGEMYIRNSKGLYLFWMKGMYENAPDKTKFFTDYFESLAGNSTLREQIVADASEEAIKKSWEPGLKKYKAMRKKYLLYKDFE